MKGRRYLKISCAYTYQYGGPEEYTGTRLELDGVKINSRRRLQRLYDRLSRAQAAGEPVPCFVNPVRPQEAVLDRSATILPFMVVALVPVFFGGIGVGLIALAAGGPYSGVREARLARQYPGQPWLWRDAWRRGVIHFHPGRYAIGMFGVAVLWNYMAATFVLAWIEGYHQIHLVLWLILGLLLTVFVFLGLGTLVVAADAIFAFYRIRRASLHLASVPGVIGGHLQGELILSGNLVSSDEVRIVLRCENTVKLSVRGRGTRRVLWKDERSFPASAYAYGQAVLRLPIDFVIPEYCPPSNHSTWNDIVTWQLELKRSVPGDKRGLSIDVPVFHAS